MFRLSEVLKVHKHALFHSFVERAQIYRTESEWVASEKVVKIPVDELPIEAVVVGDEHRAADRVVGDPRLELPHDVARVREGQRLLAR